MVCLGFETLYSNMTEIGMKEFMQFPTTCDYYFYLKIFIGLFIIFAGTLYFNERKRLGRGELLSSMAISSLGIILLSLIGTVIGFVQTDIFIIILVAGLSFIIIWFFKD